MIVDLKTITSEPRLFEFSLDNHWWRSERERDIIQSFNSPLRVRVRIYRVGDRYVLEGHLHGSFRLVCDRCLDQHLRDLKTTFTVFLASPRSGTEKTEVELAQEDLEVEYIAGEEVDLDKFIREQVFLMVPVKSLCKKDCEGLCPACGSNLNGEKCGCSHKEGHPGFSELKNLRISSSRNT
jgi:uncharacterized protein